MFHFQDERKTNHAFQTARRWRVKGDYGEFHRAITQLAPKLPKLARKGLALYMAMFHAVNPNPPRPMTRAKTRRDRGIQYRAVALGMSTAQLAKAYGLSVSMIQKILKKDCHAVGRGPGARWVYSDKLRLRQAKRRLAEHRNSYDEGPVRSCPYVAVRRGRVDRGTLRELLDDPHKLVLPRRNERSRKTGTVSACSYAAAAMGASGLAWAGQSGVPIMGEIRSLFLDHKVRADKVNGYPAFVWKNGMHVFFHEFNWLRAQGLWAKPYDGERSHIHHVNGDRLDCKPRNLVLLTGRQHMALESDKRRRKARREARQGVGLQRRR